MEENKLAGNGDLLFPFNFASVVNRSGNANVNKTIRHQKVLCDKETHESIIYQLH